MARRLHHTCHELPRLRELLRGEARIGVPPSGTLSGQERSVSRAIANDGVVRASDVYNGAAEGGRGVGFGGEDLSDGEGFGELRELLAGRLRIERGAGDSLKEILGRLPIHPRQALRHHTPRDSRTPSPVSLLAQLAGTRVGGGRTALGPRRWLLVGPNSGLRH